MKQPNAPKSVRCAIYTRKSTEEGLEQAFNSLDAQREACAAYIESQKHEGWKIVRVAYDDGGFSGGTMERPALTRLLADVDAGLIDTVVVYKIDRLTRALADFAKIVERFEKRSVTFVSVTQSFNTTTSMGRLTLNVLLSFAQFEREVTAERIRDKIAASRAKGIFMGGNPPLGYDPRKRKLVINEAEAKTVRMIFERYLVVRSVGRLAAELNARGVTTKAWVSETGRQMGGGGWYIGPLFHVLRNRVYVGDAVHKGKIYKGEHEPLLERDLFDRVQALLETNRIGYKRKIATDSPGVLTGLIFDDRGNAMTPQRSRKKSKPGNVYYVSQALLQHRKDKAGTLPRVAARKIDDLLARKQHEIFGDPDLKKVAPVDSDRAVREWQRARLRRVTVGKAMVVFELPMVVDGSDLEASVRETVEPVANSSRPNEKLNLTDDAVIVTLNIPLKTWGGRKSSQAWNRPAWTTAKATPNKALIAALVQAHRMLEMIGSGEGLSMDDMVKAIGIDRKQVRLTMRLSFLAPDIQKSILDGRQSIAHSLDTLTDDKLPAGWVGQRTQLT